MAVSSGLKRSQRVSKCVETLGAEHIRESQAVSRCHETLGAERIHASHKVTKCHATLGAGPSRASRRVSTGPKTFGAECIHGSHKVSKGPRNPRRRAHPRAPQGLALMRQVRMAMFSRARQNSAKCSQAVIVLRACSNCCHALIDLHASSTSRTFRSGVLCTAPGERASP